MKVVDANVLIYAVNEDAEHHGRAKNWLDTSLAGGAPVGFAWLALLAFVRLSTKVGLFPSPLGVDQALDIVDGWLAAPGAAIVEPTARHVSIVRELLAHTGVGANLANDAHLAALAIEHHGSVVSFDNDFDRFPGVAWERPSV